MKKIFALLLLASITSMPYVTLAEDPTDVSDWANATTAQKANWFERTAREFEDNLITLIRSHGENREIKRDALFKLMQVESLIEYEARNSSIVSSNNRRNLLLEVNILKKAVDELETIAAEFAQMRYSRPSEAQSRPLINKFQALHKSVVKPIGTSWTDSPTTRSLKKGIQQFKSALNGSLITFQSDNALTWTRD
ncbi:TPA: hypothetical protein DDZ86_05045 [Candidatus Dependentiae bacterium]|nr:MAG: hypothetical protein A2Y17_09850 [Clostridiales bacterium GWF2_38_85]HBL98978.1 hypothetical protein [Candidatus Dependentiae bacterium]